MPITIERTVYVTTIAKEHGFDIDLTKVPAHAIEAALAYGIQRWFNDKVGGEKFPTIEAKCEQTVKNVARFYEGDIGRAVSIGVDPVTKLARIEARKLCKAKWSKTDKDKLAKFMEMDSEKQVDYLDKVIEASPQLVKAAEAEIKRRNDLANAVDVDIDLD